MVARLLFVLGGLLLSSAIALWALPVEVPQQGQAPAGAASADSPHDELAPVRFSSPEFFARLLGLEAVPVQVVEPAGLQSDAIPPRLMGIAIDKTGPLVWLRADQSLAQLMREGDWISEWQVVRIDTSEVEIQNAEDQSLVLRLFEGPR